MFNIPLVEAVRETYAHPHDVDEVGDLEGHVCVESGPFELGDDPIVVLEHGAEGCGGPCD